MRQAEVILELQVDPKVDMALGNELEVQLDCSYCRRTNRTVVFTVDAPLAECCSGSARRSDGSHPPYPGRIVALEVRRRDTETAAATYRLEYDVSRFKDAKYGATQRPWSGYPTWARISFMLTCPNCGRVKDASTQSNLVRPLSHSCVCGYEFCVERRELPLLRWLDPECDEWRQVAERFGATRKQ